MNKNLMTLLIITTFLLAGCVAIQESGPQNNPGLTPEPATPTPEIFNRLDPSPTPQASSLPLTCQVTDLSVFVDQDGGYCFAYPAAFMLDGESEGVSIVSPALDESLDPVRASLKVEVQPVPETSDLAHLVDGYLSQSGFQNLPWTIQRTELSLGGEPAVRIEPIPGLGSSRQVLALHGNKLFTLRFHPVDLEVGELEVEILYQTVTGSFAFLDEEPSSQTELAPQTVEWSEFGAKISLDYNPTLAPWVETLTLPAVPLSGEVLYSESHPAAAQFRFLGYMGGRLYDLPFLPFENRVAQVTVYQTSDFAGYGDGDAFGFPSQLQTLSELLQNGVDPARCTGPLYENEQSMPFLPWLNARQTFCAQPLVIDFNSGKGVRYLTFYAQGPAPALESQIFYTFQGLTGDGKYYISASFPVTSGIFPNEPPVGQVNPDPNAFLDEMKGQVVQLNGLEASSFDPELTTLDTLMSSIRIETP